MGEEEKKTEEVKKTEEEKKEEAPKDDKTSGGDENKEEKKSDESKEDVAAVPAPPPPPPPEIVLRVYMHCEGCARKVRKSLKGFDGVEDVVTDCKAHKVVVKGEKADPLKVLERVQKKSHRQVELLSPIPKPPVEEPKKPEEKEMVKPEEKKEEPPQVIIAVLKVHMHCEACAQEIKRRIHRMKGVENVEPDLKNSQVTVKGVFEATQLVDYVSKKTGKRAVIVKVEPEKKEESPKEGKEEKKGDDTEKEAKKDGAAEEGKAAAAAAAAAADGGDGSAAAAGEAAPVQDMAVIITEDQDQKMELKKNEFYYYYPQNHQVNYNYPQRYAHEMYSYQYPPQIFSDENPNACSVM